MVKTRGLCECGHAKADHLHGVGCCVEPGDDVDDCGCGVFRPDDGDIPHEWTVQITTADGRGTFRVRAAPDASPELREALHKIAQEAYRRLELHRFARTDQATSTLELPRLSPEVSADIFDEWDHESSPTIVGVAPPANPPTRGES